MEKARDSFNYYMQNTILPAVDSAVDSYGITDVYITFDATPSQWPCIIVNYASHDASKTPMNCWNVKVEVECAIADTDEQALITRILREQLNLQDSYHSSDRSIEKKDFSGGGAGVSTGHNIHWVEHEEMLFNTEGSSTSYTKSSTTLKLKYT